VRRAPSSERPLMLLSEETLLPLPNGARLTVREHEVLRWLAAGKSNSEIAVILAVALSTVKRHVENVLTKLGVTNRTAAAARARGMARPAKRKP
jgi:DNA-binding CsgD family transcriptional regulator